jgi:hypothetical protein
MPITAAGLTTMLTTYLAMVALVKGLAPPDVCLFAAAAAFMLGRIITPSDAFSGEPWIAAALQLLSPKVLCVVVSRVDVQMHVAPSPTQCLIMPTDYPNYPEAAAAGPWHHVEHIP